MPSLPNFCAILLSKYNTTSFQRTFIQDELSAETDCSWICNNGRSSQHDNVLPNYPFVHNSKNSQHSIVISTDGNTRNKYNYMAINGF